MCDLKPDGLVNFLSQITQLRSFLRVKVRVLLSGITM